MKNNLQRFLLATMVLWAFCSNSAMADQKPNASGYLYLQKAGDTGECVIPLNKTTTLMRAKYDDTLGHCTFNSIGEMRFEQAASAVTIELKSGAIQKDPVNYNRTWYSGCFDTHGYSTFDAVIKTTGQPTTTAWFDIYTVMRTEVGDPVVPGVRLMFKSQGRLPPDNEVKYWYDLFACIIATPSD